MRMFVFAASFILLTAPGISGQNPIQPAEPGATSTSQFANYAYELPRQWTRQELRDRILLTSPNYRLANPMARPGSPPTENCQIAIFPMRPATGSLGEQAATEFRQLFHNELLVPGNGPPTAIANGISPQGWEYIFIRKLIGGQEGDSRALGATFLIAKVGDQVATIAATSKDFLWSACFSERTGDAWNPFFYSLHFVNAQPSQKALALIQQKLVGDWTTASTTIGLGYIFQPGGRYTSTGATRYYENQKTQQVFAGSGSFAIEGPALVLTGDNGRRSMHYFRIGRLSRDNGHNWRDQLCLMDPGAQGEVCFNKQ
jgi:hypothetical protein